MEQIVTAIQDNLIIIQNLNGDYFQPDGGNTLENWNYLDGYFIKINSAENLEITGYYPEIKTIQLSAGWNLIPVLSSQEVPIADLFAGNINYVEIIKEAVGLNMYWPQKQIFTLQVFIPGKSYLVKANQEFSLSF